MRFRELAWAGLCFYYRLSGDKRYSAIMCDHKFLERLRNTPEEVPLKEFEEKAVLGYINIQNYDLLLGHKLTENILAKIIDLKKDVHVLQNLSLTGCDFDDQETVSRISRIYSELHTDGLWLTGASKIAHLLNDKLLPPISLNISKNFGIEYQVDITQWLRRMQWDIQEAAFDFENLALEGTPGRFLSDKLGYLKCGYEKSLAKFIDEYYWLYYGEGLPVPPKWIPDSDYKIAGRRQNKLKRMPGPVSTKKIK
jgi:hypothetical protein